MQAQVVGDGVPTARIAIVSDLLFPGFIQLAPGCPSEQGQGSSAALHPSHHSLSWLVGSLSTPYHLVSSSQGSFHPSPSATGSRRPHAALPSFPQVPWLSEGSGVSAAFISLNSNFLQKCRVGH